jgi:hypothetical protein
VAYAGTGCNSSGHGAVLLEHGSGSWWSGYLHMTDIPAGLTLGSVVDAGTLLGHVSNVGTPDRHLHFVIYTGSNSVDGLVSFNAAIAPRHGQSSLTAPASAGTSILDVGDISIYSLADVIRINPGASNEEDKTISGFGSLDLSSPLLFDHQAGEPVVVISTSGAVGGIAELPNVVTSPEQAVESSTPNMAALIASALMAAVVLGGLALLAKQRRTTTRHASYSREQPCFMKELGCEEESQEA